LKASRSNNFLGLEIFHSNRMHALGLSKIVDFRAEKVDKRRKLRLTGCLILKGAPEN